MSDYTANHKRLFRLGLNYRGWWFALGCISLLSAVAIIVLMYSISILVDQVFMQDEPITFYDTAVIVLAGAIFFRGSLFWISEITVQHIASEIKQDLRMRLLRHMQKLGPSWAEKQSSGELAVAAVEGVEKLDVYYSRFMPAAIHMAIVPVVLALFVFGIDWISGLILIVTGPLIPVFMSLIGMKAQSQTRKQWKTLQVLSSGFLDAVQGMRTLKLFNRTAKKQGEIERISDLFRKNTIGILKTAFLSGFVLELFASIATALVAVEIGVRLIEGHIGFQFGLFVLLLAPEYYLPFRLFGAQHHAGMEGTEAAGRIFSIMDTPVRSNISAADQHKQKVAIPSGPFHIRFERVTFSYSSESDPVIKDAAFELEPGKTTVLAGRSGTGKTTLTRLITQEYVPDKGSVMVNGIPCDLFDEKQWLGQISIVNQNPWLFDDTVLANIAIAKPGAPFEEIVEASGKAAAHEFISKLPDGYQTRAGEQAVRFSGGERQRIALARAFLRNSPVVILDEPSSALDPHSELKIRKSVKRLEKDRTVLIIAHRLSTVRNADNILLLEDGRISGSGSHEQLLNTSHTYREMVTAYTKKS